MAISPCTSCGSTKEPIFDLEIMEDGSIGAGVLARCPDCGAVEA